MIGADYARTMARYNRRGRLTTLLMQQGIDPGVTDLMWMPQAEAIAQ